MSIKQRNVPVPLLKTVELSCKCRKLSETFACVSAIVRVQHHESDEDQLRIFCFEGKFDIVVELRVIAIAKPNLCLSSIW